MNQRVKLSLGIVLSFLSVQEIHSFGCGPYDSGFNALFIASGAIIGCIALGFYNNVVFGDGCDSSALCTFGGEFVGAAMGAAGGDVVAYGSYLMIRAAQKLCTVADSTENEEKHLLQAEENQPSLSDLEEGKIDLNVLQCNSYQSSEFSVECDSSHGGSLE